MNLRNVFITMVVLVLLSCNDDDYPYAEVPSVILNQFWSQYPDATDAEFNEIDSGYEVDFEISGVDHSAVFNSSGMILKEKKEIEWNELPPAVRQILQKEYGQKKMEDLARVKIGEENYYQAEVSRFIVDEKIVLNAAGKMNLNLDYWK